MDIIIGGGALAIAGSSAISAITTGVVGSTSILLSYLWYGSETNTQLRAYHRRVSVLDIPDKIKFVNAMMGLPKRTAKVCLMEDGLRTVCENILKCLQTVQASIDYHKTKWFSSYRNLCLEEELKDLEALVTILDKKITFMGEGTYDPL